VDYHPSDQYIAFTETETGECGERRLNHSDREAEKFYRELAQRGVSVRVGMEATGYSRWFEGLLAELSIEAWIGDAAEIKTKRVRKQKTDRNDAGLLLKLLLENSFPKVCVPSPENRDLRQLLWHRHRMVQMRTRIMNQLQALANERRPPKEEEAVERARTSTAREASVGYLGQPAPTRSIGAAGPDESDHRSVNCSGRVGSQETTRSAAADDAPWRRSSDGACLRADHRNSGTVPVRSADRQLCRTDSVGGLQCRPSDATTYFSAAFDTAETGGLLSPTAGGCGSFWPK
jgi:Transposase